MHLSPQTPFRSSSSVSIIGGGPAGMTAALLLARAGHRVQIFERGVQLGGLWASRLDEAGYFRGDNSCKVYQSSYHTAPALFELIGTDWRSHFTGRHDLTTDWLRPFVAECTWRDLAVLALASLKHRAGLGNFYRMPVTVFMEEQRLSKPCKAWLRATALGGIAGTLRMTVWELFHRLGSNLREIFRGSDGPLYWNTQPPNTDGGFIAKWRACLAGHGVMIHTNTSISSLASTADCVTLESDSGEHHAADAVFLAIPPPALASLLRASPEPIAQGFGLSRPQLDAFLGESVYEHVGVTWFFDTELPNELPLGGHNVRRGWHPILVQHQQYQPQLRSPAVSVVVGSVAVDTTFRHHRLGTLAGEYNLEALAALLWEDERLVDPSLPQPIDMEILGTSSATQVVHRGPLPLKMTGSQVFLATNMHGLAPYFTASLESAIQAGAIAAQHFEPAVERLPMGPDRGPLPWSVADRTGEGSRVSALAVRATPMRRLELTTPLSVDAEAAWSVLINTSDWSNWGRLVVSAEGVFETGYVWTMQLVGTDGHTKSTMNPRFVSMVPEAQVVFETRIGGGLVSIVHTFDVEPDGADRSVLRQTFVVTGVLVVPLWRWLLPGMMQFEQLGVDLAQRLRRPPAPGVPDEAVR